MGRKGVTVMSRKVVRTMITALVTASLLVLTACGKAEQAADTASLDDGAVTRLESDEGEEHYIDDNAIALAGKASTSAGVTMAQSALALINQQRAALGLAALVWSDGLAKDAQVRAQECEKSFSHTRPNGTDWWTVDSNLMYGENLAKGYDLDTAVERAKEYISGALGAMLDLGSGSGPMNHGFDISGRFAEEKEGR